MRISMQFNDFLKSTILVIILMFIASPVMADDNGDKHVLIINAYTEQAPWSQKYITNILRTVQELDNVDCKVAHMNAVVITNDSIYNEVEEGIIKRYTPWKPDIVVMVGTFAFAMADNIRAAWGDVSMLVIGEQDVVADKSWYYTGKSTNLPDEEMVPLSNYHQDYNVTFVESPLCYKETVDMMVKMVPGMKRLVFAADELFNNQRLHRLISQYIAEKYPNLTYERIIATEDGDAKLRKELFSDNSKDVAVLFSTWFYVKTTAYGQSMVVSGEYRLVTYSPRPVFSMRGVYASEDGFMGGYFFNSAEVHGYVHEALLSMIAGVQARNIPFSYCKDKHPVVDYRQLVKDHLRESDCPEGTEFLFKPETFWEQYGWAATAVVIIFLVIIFALLVVLHFHRVRARMDAKHGALVRNMPVFYAQCKIRRDKDGKPVELTYPSSNGLAKEMLDDYNHDDSDAKDFRVNELMEYAQQTLKSGENVSFAHHFISKGQYYEFVMAPSVDPDTVDVFGMDSTARVEAEEKLREANDKLELTLSVAKIIPWRWDLKDNTITCEELRILNFLKIKMRNGLDPGVRVIDANDYFKRIHPDDVPKMRELLRQCLSGETTRVKAEYRIITITNGHSRIDWMEMNAVTEKGPGERHPHSISGSLLIITERKRQEQILIQAKEKAKESDRLKSAFLANVSHEIRTPLNAIVGFSNLLTQTEDKTERTEYVEIIENNNQLLLQLISDILDLSKIEAGSFHISEGVVDVNKVMHYAEHTVENRLKMGVELRCVISEPECVILSDRNRITQVLVNLLTNAIKFTPEGSVTLGYELRRDSHEIYFYVADTGVGISREGQARVFERFVKLNTFAQGTGLGLAICKSVVNQMGGQIGVRSEGEGKGSTFWFTLPYSPVTSLDTTEEVYEHKKIENRRIKILIAEDNQDNYLLLKSLLSKDYDLLHAADGVEAVEMFKEHNPDIILMDIYMPRLNGYEATLEIRKLSKSVPIVAVTAYAYDSDRERILNSGFNDYIPKPLNGRKLHDTLSKLITRCFFVL